MTATIPSALLGIHDPHPVRATDGGDRRWLVICDHAGAQIPARLGDLGVEASDRLDHIGWDIGAAHVARRIAERLDAPLVEGVYSRLVVDGNRYPEALDAVPATSDRRQILGNRDLSTAERQQRILAIFEPYHAEIDRRLTEACAAGLVPALLSIHSCAPSMNGAVRPWQIGVGWVRDRRMSDPLLAALRARGDMTVGDNEPYGLDLGLDFSTPEHAMARGLPHLQIEFRQDLLTTQADAERWADRFTDALLSLGQPAGWDRVEQHLTPADGVDGFAAWRARLFA